MEKQKLITLYHKWMKTGTMGTPRGFSGGLCNQLPAKYKEDLTRFTPLDNMAFCERTFWAYNGVSENGDYVTLAYTFTPLRQAIVLLICAMNDEL